MKKSVLLFFVLMTSLISFGGHIEKKENPKPPTTSNFIKVDSIASGDVCITLTYSSGNENGTCSGVCTKCAPTVKEATASARACILYWSSMLCPAP